MKPEPRRFSIDIRATPAEVWQQLTQTEVRQAFYFNSRLVSDLRPGSPIRYESDNGKTVFIVGRIVSVDPPRRLVHTFRFSDLDDDETTVTIEVIPTDSGVRVDIAHDGLEHAPRTAKRVQRGWPHILGNLQTYVRTGRLPFRSRVAYGVMGFLQPLMPS